ncbi:hypothetical protein DFP89_1551 [Paracoccus lutimaris]|uniref:Uncharacterized protein n=1 Tax=Paracoccus lutimaris TaxID=1490030 RepID=A0A368YC57_9RHOB|nr:hypothetical protein DFP89_1551 [Paracoccus lutimaris]
MNGRALRHEGTKVSGNHFTHLGREGVHNRRADQRILGTATDEQHCIHFAWVKRSLVKDVVNGAYKVSAGLRTAPQPAKWNQDIEELMQRQGRNLNADGSAA